MGLPTHQDATAVPQAESGAPTKSNYWLTLTRMTVQSLGFGWEPEQLPKNKHVQFITSSKLSFEQ